MDDQTTTWVPTDISQLAWGGEPILDSSSEQERDLEGQYAEVFHRVACSVLSIEDSVAQERSQVPELIESLLAHPSRRRELLIRNSRRHQTSALSQALVRESLNLVRKNPAESRDLAQLATAVADRLDSARYGHCLVQDIRAAAWGQYANTLRVISELRKADRAFGIAEHCLANGTGDPLEQARFFELLSLLRRAQRRFDESASLMEKAISLYRDLADSRMEGRALASLGIQHAIAGDLPEAIRRTHEALSRLDPATDARLICQAKYNLLNMRFLSGDAEGAAAGLAEARRHFVLFGDETSLLRLRWLEARIDAELGKVEAAEGAFMEARDGFIEKGVAYNAALISLELAALYSRQGKTSEVKRLVGEMLPIFQSRDIHREALAALMLYRDAVQTETATVALAEEVKTFLEKARGNTKLRFRDA